MIKTDKNVYIEETEVKPNKYTLLVLYVALVSVISSWIFNEIGLFRVGKWEMRIGSIIPITCSIIPIVILTFNKKAFEDKRMKYVILTCCSILTFSVTTLITFHTTIMLLFPMFIAMLYRSKTLGNYAFIWSLFCTIFTPILGYVIGSWDIEYFKELILIGTGGTADIIGATYTVTWVAIGKICLYIVLPRLMMIGACVLLMFYVIRLGADHVNNQILLNNLSHKDHLTNLFNRNYLYELIKNNDITGNIGIIFFDCNYLKEANDSKGHEYGDLLLKQCAKSIIENLTEGKDYGFRIGGDEFLVLIEEPDKEYIENKIKDIDYSLNVINEENKYSFNELVCSMAHGYTMGDANIIHELIDIADTYMYKNKQEMKAKLNH